jgi:flagellar basal-body rod protein FlgB
MNEISDKSIMTALGRQLTTAVAKQAVAAGNLANLDTPGFRTREVSFDEVLDAQFADAAALKVTNEHHVAAQGSGGAGGTLHETQGLAMRRDGNNVEIDRELLKMSRASADFTAAETALAAKFRLLHYAINESR